ncbi:hypothetical protein OX284_003135 [Flavobacterium sp. SUN046]|uniref:hypothetical protein n=1 Tax=Flavobacterium sp. SUN046 TaxID=3002440 RepID=UPI002DB8E332|nr:hypothetical protein [Flavobacterium sp. SUN046]MEC4048411.1 hypothetical protein [Flavobacterium sp. SUN046]
MVTVITTQEVKNFLEWKKVFDSAEELRKLHQIETIGVFVSVDNPDEITCISNAPSIEAFHNHFYNNPEIKEVRSNSGVVVEAQVKFFNKISDL